MKTILSILLMLGYGSIVLYYMYLNSEVKLLGKVSQWMSIGIGIGLVVIIRAYITKTQKQEREVK
jgi:glycerol uptake facilitator-like aquaporin